MGKRVLLCDDDLDILRPTEFALKRDGAEVILACDGQEAWDVMQKVPPDVLVTDWQMPRLDGVELVQRMRQDSTLVRLPVIMITGKYDELIECDRTTHLDLQAVVSKPFSPRELNRQIQQVMEFGVPGRTTIKL